MAHNHPYRYERHNQEIEGHEHRHEHNYEHEHRHEHHDYHHSKDKMRAVVWEGKPFEMSVKSVPRPRILAKEDAIVRITTAAICGTDLHTYHGIFGSENPPWGMGHEAIGIVIEVGAATKTIKVGDRVIVPDAPADGHLDLKASAAPLQGVTGFGFGKDFGNLGGLQGTYLTYMFSHAERCCDQY